MRTACYTTTAVILTALDAFHAGRLALAPVTLVFIALEMLSARYRGVGWQIVNPRRQPGPEGERRDS